MAQCRADSALRRQKAATLRVGGAHGLFVGAAPLACVVVWQLSVALAEEAYYRGFVQSAAQSALSTALTAAYGGAAAGSISGRSGGSGDAGGWLSGLAASDAGALVLAAAMFGAAHVPWEETESNGTESSEKSGGKDQRLEWFLETGAWGLLYGAVFAASGCHLLAPVGCHAAQNVWWCAEDLQLFAAATDAEVWEVLSEEEGGGGSDSVRQ
jgi:membrane protease YdiL (CAAX protease family)